MPIHIRYNIHYIFPCLWKKVLGIWKNLLHIFLCFSQNYFKYNVKIVQLIGILEQYLFSIIFITFKCMCLCLVNQLCPTLRLHGLLPARLLCPWDSPSKNSGVFLAMPAFRVSSQPRDWTQVSHMVGRFFTIWATMKAL